MLLWQSVGRGGEAFVEGDAWWWPWVAGPPQFTLYKLETSLNCSKPPKFWSCYCILFVTPSLSFLTETMYPNLRNLQEGIINALWSTEDDLIKYVILSWFWYNSLFDLQKRRLFFMHDNYKTCLGHHLAISGIGPVWLVDFWFWSQIYNHVL